MLNITEKSTLFLCEVKHHAINWLKYIYIKCQINIAVCSSCTLRTKYLFVFVWQERPLYHILATFWLIKQFSFLTKLWLLRSNKTWANFHQCDLILIFLDSLDQNNPYLTLLHELFTVNTNLAEIAELASKDLTTAKKVTSSGARLDTRDYYWFRSPMPNQLN